MSLPTANDGPIVPSDDEVATMVFDQFPALVGREIGRRYLMRDHVTVRIGDDYGVLMPIVPGEDHLYARVAGLLEPLLPTWTFPTSAPIATGVPQGNFPYHFTLVPWLSGSTAAFVPLHGDSAPVVGDALRQLHGHTAESSPANPVTAVTLDSLQNNWRRLLTYAITSGAPENRVLDATKADALWRRAAATPVDAHTWTHGTLEPHAVLSDRGTFSGLLMWHRFGGGDPAADLGYVANLFSLDDRPELLAGYGEISTATSSRAEGWQLLGALRLIETGDPFLVRLAWERLIEFDVVSEG
jgi:aminoglycoside phosphotransferase (APT) family kinase protein